MMSQRIIVLDNSVNSRLLWPDQTHPGNNDYAVEILQQCEEGAVFYVPTIWHYELAQVVYKLRKLGFITEADAQIYFNQMALLPVVTDTLSHGNTSTRIYLQALSLQYNLSIYDGAYLELALRLGAELASNDDSLVRAAKESGVAIALRV